MAAAVYGWAADALGRMGGLIGRDRPGGATASHEPRVALAASPRARSCRAGDGVRQVRAAAEPGTSWSCLCFGSHARGTARSDSDVDLLVIMPVDGSRREAAVEIGTLLHDIRIPKDIVVVTPESFAWRRDVIGTIEWPAAHEGSESFSNTHPRSDSVTRGS